MAFVCHGTRWTARSGGPASHPLFFVDKTPDGSHQMGNRDVNTPFPENLRDPMNAETATVRLQDLFLILSQGVDLGLPAITAAFRAAGDLKKILGSGFEMIRISQRESPRVFRFMIKKGQIGD
jgi:hypothetical protein